jgi:predicted RNase H-like nuclease (RuvC/YqgF family)
MRKFEEWWEQYNSDLRRDGIMEFKKEGCAKAWQACHAEIETKQRECDILKSSVESYIKLVSGLETELTDLRGRMEALAEKLEETGHDATASEAYRLATLDTRSLLLAALDAPGGKDIPMTDSARKRAEKLHRMWCSHSGTGHPIWLDKAVEMFTAHDRELWTQAQEQMREKVALLKYPHPYVKDDYGQPVINSLCEMDRKAIRALPLDPLPAGESTMKGATNVQRGTKA